MLKFLHLIIGGISGTLARYFLTGAVHQAWGTSFPYGTLVVNLIGCFLIGLLAALSEGKLPLDANTRLLLVIGFCGAFTTFSSFVLDTANLMKHGEDLRAFVNIALSVAAGFLAFKLGVVLADLF